MNTLKKILAAESFDTCYEADDELWEIYNTNDNFDLQDWCLEHGVDCHVEKEGYRYVLLWAYDYVE